MLKDTVPFQLRFCDRRGLRRMFNVLDNVAED